VQEGELRDPKVLPAGHMLRSRGGGEKNGYDDSQAVSERHAKVPVRAQPNRSYMLVIPLLDTHHIHSIVLFLVRISSGHGPIGAAMHLGLCP
jgi:hypothetical protein